MANLGIPAVLQGINMTPQQLQAIIAWNGAEKATAEATGKAAQAKADQDILDQAKAERNVAAQLRSSFILRNRCKDSFMKLNHMYSM